MRTVDSIKAFASGPVPYRVLIVGAESIADSDPSALAEGVAQGIAARTGHGVDVDGVDAARSALLMRDQDLSRLDAVVVVLDPARDGDDLTASTTADLAERLTVGSALVVVVPPVRPGALTPRRQARLMDAAIDTAGPLTRVVRLADLPGRTQEERVAGWATDIVDVTSGALIDPMVRVRSQDPFDEFDRVDTVRGIGHRYTEWVDEFQHVVDTARSTYGTPSAAMSIIDDETTRYFARTGNVAVSLPRGKTVCNRVMRIYGGLILGDARLDPRFAGLPEVKTGDVRFYAGYRITGPDGAPFGALCVFDSEPRDVCDDDLVTLRDLALGAQLHLWSLLPTAAVG